MLTAGWLVGAALAAAPVVLSTRADPEHLRSVECVDCQQVWIGDPCMPDHADTVVISGHSRPPDFLWTDAATVARAVACHSPNLVVLDTCYGFALPLLSALSHAGVDALVVGSTRKLPPDGLVYDPQFFLVSDPAVQARLVSAPSGESLEVWRLAAPPLARVETLVAGWSVDVLEARLQRVWPNLVRAPLGDGEVLVVVPPERFRRDLHEVGSGTSDPE